MIFVILCCDSSIQKSHRMSITVITFTLNTEVYSLQIALSCSIHDLTNASGFQTTPTIKFKQGDTI